VNIDNLTVISVVEHDRGLVDLMIKSVEKFTDPVPDFILCDNGDNGNLVERYAGKSNVMIVKNTPALSGGSNRHGDGLNKIFPLVKTTRTAIVETDCIVLRKGWDKLEFPTYKMLAAKKGEQAGQPFYHVCFMVFSTGLLKHGNGIDFRAGKDSTRGNRNYKLWEDVGWQIRDKVRIDQIKLLEFIDCKSGNGKFFNKDFQSDEFWLDGEPVVAHFGRGSNVAGKAIRKGFEHPEKQLERWKETALKIIGE